MKAAILLIAISVVGCAATDNVTRITYAKAGGVVKLVQGEASTCTFRTNDDGVTVQRLLFTGDACVAEMKRDWQIGGDE
jgi:hypothetical protein